MQEIIASLNARCAAAAQQLEASAAQTWLLHTLPTMATTAAQATFETAQEIRKTCAQWRARLASHPVCRIAGADGAPSRHNL